jgi:nucleoside-diphosphate-sugar epimerase
MKDETILITGSAGLIGRGLAKRLERTSAQIIRYDLRHRDPDGHHDLHDALSLKNAVRRATGIVHLAAVARVGEGEDDPERCWSTNVEATRSLLRLASQNDVQPWVLFGSSREVYGQQTSFPVNEDASFKPVNAYARSKVAAERLMEAAREEGLPIATVRFSNVYGDTADYADRVVPAFAAAAAHGGTLRMDGPGNALDFTHVDDVVEGLYRVMTMLSAGEKRLPIVHLVSGIRTTLAELAAMAIANGARGTRVSEGPSRSYAVGEFFGDRARALALFGWRARVLIESGLTDLISCYAQAHVASPVPASENI